MPDFRTKKSSDELRKIRCGKKISFIFGTRILFSFLAAFSFSAKEKVDVVKAEFQKNKETKTQEYKQKVFELEAPVHLNHFDVGGF